MTVDRRKNSSQNSSNLNTVGDRSYWYGKQLFQLWLRLKSTSATAIYYIRFVEKLFNLQLLVTIVEPLFVIDRSDPVWGMSLYQNVSFPVQEHLKLFQLSGRLARRLFCIPWYFVVPHFISFNCKLLNKQFSQKQKATIQSVWSDLMSLVFPDWLTPSPLFFLYIFAIPPGWFGRIRKPLHSKRLNTASIFNQPVRYKSQWWTLEFQWSLLPGRLNVHDYKQVKLFICYIVLSV